MVRPKLRFENPIGPYRYSLWCSRGTVWHPPSCLRVVPTNHPPPGLAGPRVTLGPRTQPSYPGVMYDLRSTGPTTTSRAHARPSVHGSTLLYLRIRERDTQGCRRREVLFPPRNVSDEDLGIDQDISRDTGVTSDSGIVRGSLFPDFVLYSRSRWEVCQGQRPRLCAPT